MGWLLQLAAGVWMMDGYLAAWQRWERSWVLCRLCMGWAALHLLLLLLLLLVLKEWIIRTRVRFTRIQRQEPVFGC